MGPIPFRVWRHFVGVQLFSSGSLGLRLLRFFMLEGFGVLEVQGLELSGFLRFRLVWIRVPGTEGSDLGTRESVGRRLRRFGVYTSTH